jgi:hypothetical protein
MLHPLHESRSTFEGEGQNEHYLTTQRQLQQGHRTSHLLTPLCASQGEL